MALSVERQENWLAAAVWESRHTKVLDAALAVNTAVAAAAAAAATMAAAAVVAVAATKAAAAVLVTVGAK